MFSYFLNSFLSFSTNLKLSDANTSSLEESKIWDRVNCVYTGETFYTLSSLRYPDPKDRSFITHLTNVQTNKQKK